MSHDRHPVHPARSPQHTTYATTEQMVSYSLRSTAYAPDDIWIGFQSPVHRHLEGLLHYIQPARHSQKRDDERAIVAEETWQKGIDQLQQEQFLRWRPTIADNLDESKQTAAEATPG